ncbi:hypothetical protein HDU88_002471 [Geranomyces variabilis]|nr:hypothetical protein HDU88_002471 [Geranomyces variabilis]
MAADSNTPPPPPSSSSQASPPQSLFGRALGYLGLSTASPALPTPPPSQPANPQQPRTPSPPPAPQPQQQHSPAHHHHSTLDVPDAVWENPYHPLPGPPETPEERAQLAKIIQQERTALTTAVAKKQTQLSLAQAAKRNCADYDLEYNRCMIRGSWFERMRLCPEQKKSLDRCMEIQKQNLQLLGYNKESLTARERAIIADEADQAYLQAMKEAIVADGDATK